ncbi:MAG: DEAD/DEAH box helicase [archaeon]
MPDYFSGEFIRDGKIERRLYQELISANVLRGGNTLVVLPTAMGKTAIAAVVIAARISKLGGNAILITPTKPLAEQHAKTLSEFLNIPAIAITGEIPAEKRREAYKSARAICVTAPAIRNDILTGVFSLSDTVVAVFDEAHHCVKNDSYVMIASEYQKIAKNPMILALTASPGHTNERVDEICRNLSISRVEARTESDPDVSQYVSKVSLDFVQVELPPEFLKVRELLFSVLRGYLRGLKAAGLIESADSGFITKRELLAAKSRAAALRDFSSIAGTAGAIKILHSIELLETQGICSLNEFIGRMKVDGSKSAKQISALEDFRQAESISRHLQARGIDHPKLDRLVALVSGNKAPSIIFAHYRSQAKKISEILSSAGTTSRIFLGQKEGFTQKKQKETIEAFRKEEFQVLVSTSVGEEGIDIPSVDLIIFYEPVPSAIRHIQRRGRTGRKGEGRVVVLYAKGTRDEAYKWISHRNEKAMREIIKSARFAKKEERAANKTLFPFIKTDEDAQEPVQPKILADSREIPSGLVAILKNQNFALEISALSVGDFIISDSIAIERKTALDFVSSIIDGRLFEQAAELSRNFDRPLIILEAENGLSSVYSVRNIHPNAIRGALVSIALDFGIPIILSSGIEETAAVISVIAKREFSEGNPPQVKGKRRGKNLLEQQEILVAALPDINLTLARRLLARFGTPARVFLASEKELCEVGGIGKVTASKIRQLLLGETGAHDGKE